MTIGRRAFLRLSGGLMLAGSVPACATAPAAAPRARLTPRSEQSPFAHGVASGDPLPDRVVLWTRAQRAQSPEPVEVGWFCALDPDGRERVAGGSLLARAERDHTVAIDVTGLTPGRTYYYGFSALGWSSPVGRTRTAPTQAEQARFAVASCANYSAGFFNGYRCIAEQPDLDAVIHLGDYIYEYGAGKHAGPRLDREPEPPHELVTLDDYRERYAQYRSDPDLQAAHAQHPFVVVWDDHESANNSWLGGAKNHDASEGSWSARLQAATRAYMEWLPIRPTPTPEGGRLYRAFRFGTLCDLLMLDGRIVGRDAPVTDDHDWSQLMDPQRSMLGAPQERWLREHLARSRADGVAWRLLGQQTMMAQLRRPDGAPANDDQWDGYHAARERLLNAIEQGGIDDVVVLTGDIHSSWANEIAREPFDPARYDPATSRGALATELVCPGITSASPYLKPHLGRFPAWVRKTHPHVRYLEAKHRGYVTLELTRSSAHARWHLLETVDEPSTAQWLDAELRIDAGQARLHPVWLRSGGDAGGATTAPTPALDAPAPAPAPSPAPAPGPAPTPTPVAP